MEGQTCLILIMMAWPMVHSFKAEDDCWSNSECSVTCGAGTQTWECYTCEGQGDLARPCPVRRAKREIYYQERPCDEGCCPVSCGWGSWGTWETCSKSCGTGSKVRTRSKTRTESCGGSACSGSSTASTPCNTQCCPVACIWGSWGSWGTCSKPCGTGNKVRTRSKNTRESCDGPCDGLSSSSEGCNEHCCPVSCLWGSWGSWGACTKPCGTGSKVRTRSKAITEACGGSACSESSTDSETCNTQCCSVSCLWGSWGSWGACTKPCGTGSKVRTRSKAITEACGGSACSESSTDSETCNTQCCSVSCLWGSWGSWGACTKPCGTGSKVRTRSKAITEACGGSACSESSTDSETCNTQCCPVNCAWSNWEAWGSCSATCDYGTKSRTRNKSVPSSCGGSCSGTGLDSTSCYAGCCPVDCIWENWNIWGSCSKTCGTGSRTRDRSKVIVETCGGACQGQNADSQTCNTNCCPVDCTWKPWSTWGVCEDSCGASIKRRTREENPAVCGGEMCQGEKEETHQCDENIVQGCPVNCEWSLWSPWNSCSVSCGSGERKRLRTKYVVEKNGGTCSGPSEESESCEMNMNPTDCVLDAWGSWGDCQGSCDTGGIKVRSRHVTQNATACGKACDTNQQNTGACVIAGCSGTTSAPSVTETGQEENTQGRTSGLSLTTIIGIAVGGFVLIVIVLIIGVVVCCIRRNNDAGHRQETTSTTPAADGLKLDRDLSKDTTYTELEVNESAVYAEIYK